MVPSLDPRPALPDAVSLAALRALLTPPGGGSSLPHLLALLCALLVQVADVGPVAGHVPGVLACLPPWAASLPDPRLPRLSLSALVDKLHVVIAALAALPSPPPRWSLLAGRLDRLLAALDAAARFDREAA